MVTSSVFVSLLGKWELGNTFVGNYGMVTVLIGGISNLLGTAVRKVDVIGTLGLVTVPLLLVAEVGAVVWVVYAVFKTVVCGGLFRS